MENPNLKSEFSDETNLSQESQVESTDSTIIEELMKNENPDVSVSLADLSNDSINEQTA